MPGDRGSRCSSRCRYPRKTWKTLIPGGPACIKLGQSATTLSCGETQHVKLSREPGKRVTGLTPYILEKEAPGSYTGTLPTRTLDVAPTRARKRKQAA